MESVTDNAFGPPLVGNPYVAAVQATFIPPAACAVGVGNAVLLGAGGLQCAECLKALLVQHECTFSPPVVVQLSEGYVGGFVANCSGGQCDVNCPSTCMIDSDGICRNGMGEICIVNQVCPVGCELLGSDCVVIGDPMTICNANEPTDNLAQVAYSIEKYAWTCEKGDASSSSDEDDD